MSQSRKINVHFKREGFNSVYYDLLDDDTRTQIFFGGGAGGKSVFVAQRCIYDLLNGGRNYLCCRNIGRTIRNSIFNELTKYIDVKGLIGLFSINKSEMTITCITGYQAIMTGLDDVEKIKSITPRRGVITDIWIEEATECLENDVKQLAKRLRGLAQGIRKRIILTFNPILRSHWIFKRFFKNFNDGDRVYRDENLLIFKTTYKDNAFLEQDDIDELENEVDQYFYQVYTLGNWGVLGDVIFTNWQKTDLLNDPIVATFDLFKNGLDFGYSNDPTAFVRAYYHRAQRKIFIINEYESLEVTNDQIANALKPMLNGDNVICDSAEPKSIKELNNHGVSALGALKGKDSVLHGIQWLKQQEIVVDQTCQGVINNLQQYQWKKDKEGNTLNTPVDRNNDFIDALRYAFEDEMLMGAGIIEAHGEMESARADW